jgi:hypothetical protein
MPRSRSVLSGVFVIVLMVALVARPSPTAAQVVGSIVGHVYDQGGQPLKGIRISGRSDTQIGGEKIAYSNDDGYFRLAGLQPGIFELRASAPKLKTVLQ